MMRRRRISWVWIGVILAVALFVWPAVWLPTGWVLVLLVAALSAGSLFVLWWRRGVQPSAWSIIATAGAAFYYMWVLVELDARWYIKALLLIPGGVLMSIANAAMRADSGREQRRRDAVATAILRSVSDSARDVPEFALFLRPFDSTARLPAQPVANEFAGGTDSFPTHLDVESLLARALRKECPLIALGREAEMQEGAGRATVAEEEWQDAVVRLAERAAFRVVVPSAHPGTLWELEHLVRAKLVARTLFLMPEQLHGAPSGVWVSTEDDRLFDAGIRRYSADDHQYDFGSEWATAAERAKPLGIHLPPYAPAGALFVLAAETGRMARSAPLALSVLARRAWYLRAAVHHLGLLRIEDADGADALEAFATAVSLRGRTLEYALVVTADLYLAWSDTDVAAELLRRAASAGGRRQRISRSYAESLERQAAELLAAGDEARANDFRELAAVVQPQP